jgi:endonuclease YncB( thermonuclease family)
LKTKQIEFEKSCDRPRPVLRPQFAVHSENSVGVSVCIALNKEGVLKQKGLLTVVGSLDISQFWPAAKGTSSSDGDTVHLKVDPNNSFLFSASPTLKPKVTKKFIGAVVNDRGKLKKVITAKDEIKIRLQGIDTPELHFPVIGKFHPSKKGKFANEFRQPFGAGAANALHHHLKGLVGAGGGTVIHATFVTQISQPNDAIDSHGRFVGDIIVGTSAPTSVNTWLVENGWAYPLLYDSMTATEVQTILKAWSAGKSLGARPGKAFAKALQPFDPTMNVGNAKLPDAGKVNFPKIFRRQATFWSQVAGPLTAAEFVTLINKGLARKPDTAYPTPYFLSHIGKLDPKKRVKFASQIGAQGQALFTPADPVFREDPATLLDASGKPVRGWA